MRNIPDLRLASSKSDDFEANISFGPFAPGGAATIGHGLRRTLLSSIPGCYIHSVIIDGVSHKFSTLTGMKEDVIHFIQNLKQIRFKLLSEFVDAIRLRIDVKGPATVRSSNLSVYDENDTESISILDNIYLCTLNKGAHLKCDVFVERGYGYVDAVQTNDTPQPGRILVNNIANAVTKVTVDWENTRFGEHTDYEMLNLYLKTDGSIDPMKAVNIASSILTKQFSVISGGVDIASQHIINKHDAIIRENLAKGVGEIGLSEKTVEALHTYNIKTVGDLVNCTEAYLLEIPRFGRRKIQDIQAALAVLHLGLKDARIIAIEKDV